MNDKTILVIEDDREVATTVQTILRSAGLPGPLGSQWTGRTATGRGARPGSGHHRHDDAQNGRVSCSRIPDRNGEYSAWDHDDCQ